MQWGDTLRFALWALLVDKVKASLTMLGVIMGTTSIVMVITIVSTGRAYISNQIESIGSNLAYVSLDRSGGGNTQEDELTLGDLHAARTALPLVTIAAGTYDLPVDLGLRGATRHARLVGVTEDFQPIRKLRVISGRYFDQEDFNSRLKACVITDTLAKAAFRTGPAVGQMLNIARFQCLIIGTFRESISTFGQSEIQDATVLVPFPLIQSITGDNFLQVIYAQAPSPAEVPNMTDSLKRLIASRHRRQARYSVQNLTSLLQTATQISRAMTVVLIGLTLLMFTVSGVGIMNIMLVNVTQRTREIGVRKAIGAKPFDIQLQFLLEAVFISGAGAVIGIILAFALVSLIRSAVPEGVVKTSWLTIPLGMLIPTAIGVLFGYKPAAQAARMNPIEALRSE
ncbi:MAG TPA: ABC transporter permease [Terriglobales bacterium]|nr:ABC transporter permease [Terriglobales bacterium]